MLDYIMRLGKGQQCTWWVWKSKEPPLWGALRGTPAEYRIRDRRREENYTSKATFTFLLFSAACAAARRATGTRNGEQET